MKSFNRMLVLALTVGIVGLLAACSPQATPAMNMSMGDEATPDTSMNMSMGMEMPSDLDTSTTVASELGLFKVSYASSQTAETINEMFSWTVHIEKADGAPVEDAEISIKASMPQHGHGMPTEPQVTKNLGGGDYLLEGLKYSMTGWWEETLTITSGDQTDLVTFNQVLK